MQSANSLPLSTTAGGRGIRSPFNEPVHSLIASMGHIYDRGPQSPFFSYPFYRPRRERDDHKPQPTATATIVEVLDTTVDFIADTSPKCDTCIVEALTIHA